MTLRRSLLRTDKASSTETFGSLKIRNFGYTRSCLQLESCLKLRWCGVRDLFGSQIAMNTEEYYLVG